MYDRYLHALPNMKPLVCTFRDPHCEGAINSALVGTMEPMTVIVLSLYNVLRPDGYRYVGSNDVIVEVVGLMSCFCAWRSDVEG